MKTVVSVNSFRCGLMALACALANMAGVAAPRFTLVRAGKPACVIVIAEQANENAAFAARELQAYVEKITGAQLPILLDSDKILLDEKVLVGRSRLTDTIPGLSLPDGVTPALREEGYVIRATADTLVLAGNDTFPYYGTRYAVDDLLKQLGVRWFLPGEYGEVLPAKTTTLMANAQAIAARPDFAMRSFWAHAETPQRAEERELWMIRNRMNPRSPQWFGVPGDGSLNSYLPKEFLKDHPEWFALQPDGTRNPNLLCMADELRRADPHFQGQPRILDEIVKKIGADVQAGKRVSAMAPDDGVPDCQCDLCKKISFRFNETLGPNREGDVAPEYATSQEWFFFVDRLLEAVGQRYPGQLVATNGYANRTVPPEAPAGFNRFNNLTVMFADIMGCTVHRYDDPKCWLNRRQYEMIKRWCALSDKVWLYGYCDAMMVRKNTLIPMFRRYQRNIPLLKQAGLIGFNDEDEDDMSCAGTPTFLTRMALEWDTKTDVGVMLADYYRKWFGSAARPMQDYYATLADAFDRVPAHGHEDVVLPFVYSPQVMSRLEKNMLQAGQLASNETEMLHVRVERLMFDHLRDFILAYQARRELRFTEAARLMADAQAIKKKLYRISPFFGWHPYPVYQEDWEEARMTRVAARVDGPDGALLVALPEAARFRTDRHNVGIYRRYMEASVSDANWQWCKSIGWQHQSLKDEDGRPMQTADGHAWQGYGWYRYQVVIPESAGKPVHFFCPAAVNQVWVWVNGQYAGRTLYKSPWFRPQEVDIDITPFVKPGRENLIALRVRCDEDYFGVNGLYERPFIYMERK